MNPLLIIHATASALCICIAAPVLAQSQDDQQAQAEAALIEGNPQAAIAMTQDILSEQPATFAPLFLKALAHFELGQHRQAATAASAAFPLAVTQQDRRRAAQLAGNAWKSVGAYQRAAFWLRRAAQHAESSDAWQAIASSYQQLRAENPLSLSIGGWIAPTDNINRGAENETFQLEGLPFDFILPPERVALSGIEYAVELGATYRLSQTPIQRTTVGLAAFGQTYTLSSEAQVLAPDAEGGDFSFAAVDLSALHERLILDGQGPSTIGINVGQIWSAGEPTWRYASLSLGQEFRPNTATATGIRLAHTRQTPIDTDVADVKISEIAGSISHRLQNGDAFTTSLTYIHSDGGFENVFTEFNGDLEYAWAQPVFGISLSATAGLGNRNYDTFPTTLDGRRDRFGHVGLQAVINGISYWGFSPSVSVEANRTISSAEEFTSSSVHAQIGVQSEF